MQPLYKLQIEENIETAETAIPNALNETELRTIDQLRQVFQENIKIPCTFCEYCMPCPEGVFIPKIFQAVNGISWYPKSEWHRGIYTELSTTPEALKKSPNSGNATFCVECGQCVEHCPQGIDIPTELKKIHRIFTEKLTARDVYH